MSRIFAVVSRPVPALKAWFVTRVAATPVTGDTASTVSAGLQIGVADRFADANILLFNGIPEFFENSSSLLLAFDLASRLGFAVVLV